jgi:chromate transporter
MESDSDERAAPVTSRSGGMKEVGLFMLRMGLTAFGGPAAHIAMLEREVVHERCWLSQEAFLDRLGATNLIPGPNSTQMMMHVGMDRAGVPGLWLAGAGFILPASLITLAFAAAYVAYGSLPQAQAVLTGIKPGVLAIIAAAIWRLGRGAVKSVPLGLLGAVVLALYLWRGVPLVLLLGSGAVGVLLAGAHRRAPTGAAALLWLAPATTASSMNGTAAATPTPWGLGLFFLKIGSVLFGSGYVLLAFLQEGLVHQRGWLTPQQLLDAVAVGQFTPGPVFSTATFIGYLVAGLPGAALATVGIFLPSFLLVWITHPLVPRLRRTLWTGGFLDGVNVGAIALMAGVSAQLAIGTLTTWPSWLIAALALPIVIWSRLNSAWVILAGALLGWALPRV